MRTLHPAIMGLAALLAGCSASGGGGGKDPDSGRPDLPLVVSDPGHPGKDVPSDVPREETPIPDVPDPGPPDPGPIDPGFVDLVETDMDTPDPGEPDPAPVDPGPDSIDLPDPGVDAVPDPGPPDIPEVPDVPDTSDPGKADEGTVFDPGVPALDPGSCRAYYECVSACPAGVAGMACAATCQGNLSTDGMQKTQALQTCLSDAGCFDKEGDAFNECLDASCLDPYFQCFSGDFFKTCKELGSCLGDCPDDDPKTTDVVEGQECVNTCFVNATVDANWKYENLRDCLVSHACIGLTGEALDQCVTGNCLEPYFQCFAGSKFATCIDLEACFDACPEDDPATPALDEAQECVNDCFDDGTTQANIDYETLRQCLLGNCPSCGLAAPTADQKAECSACRYQMMRTTCKAAYQKCTVTGTAFCAATFDCANACTDEPCVKGCVNAGTITAQALLFSLWDCLSANCTDPLLWNTCANAALDGACKDEHADCQADAG
jgi:hypothetical protein